MKKYNNINEEISRMKSLFGESNLYGNLLNEEIEEKKHLVVEQKWMKNLLFNTAKNTDAVLKKLRVAVKSVDDAMATKFLNYRVANVGDMVAYLDTFPNIWRTALGEQGFNRLKQSMVALNDPNYVKRVQDLYNTDPKKGAMFLDAMGNGLPIEVRPLFDELANASIAGKDIDDVIDTAQVVVIKKGDETTIHTIAPDGTVIKSNSIDEAGDLIEPDVKTKTNAQAEVDARLKGEGSGGKLSPDNGSQTITDPVNPKTNPDVINGQILDAIDVGIGKAKGMVKQNVTISELSAHMKKNGGVIFIKEGDSLIPIKNIDEWEVVTMKKVDPSDGLEKDFVVSITKKGTSPDLDGGKPTGDGGGGNGAGPDKSKWKKWWEKQKNRLKDKSGVERGKFDYFRYFFPQTSFLLHKLVWLTGNSKKNLGIYKNPRWSALNLKYKDKGTWLDLSVKGAAKTTFRTGENSLRLVSEQLFYGYAVGVGMDIYRTDWGASGDTRLNPLPHWQRWFDEDNDLLIYTSLPTYGLYRTVKYIAESYTVWDALKEECLKKWEEVYGSDKVLNTQEYKDCVKEVDDFKKEVKNWETQLETFYTFIEQIDGLSEMSNEEKERFCNGEEVNGVSRKELINRLTELKNAENKIRTKINEVKSRQPSWVEVVYTVVKNWVGTATENLESILLSYTDNEGNSVELTSDGLDALIERVEKVCLNLKQKDVPIDTPNNNQINNSESEEGDCMCPDGSYSAECCEDDVSFQINIIPINIIDEDMG